MEKTIFFFYEIMERINFLKREQAVLKILSNVHTTSNIMTKNQVGYEKCGPTQNINLP